ncbi:MAG TPA: 2-amino-4-hydroxy-6-hydroxymethyldihydropteridine diphosphokinase, partial [Pantoea sp.]|nr:2-amino-4-hydroxy-6-hydroxymethyldihydropteridine diphosphokinase [Pantoea sp.]
DAVINSDRLIVPHYDLLNRAFMLVPLLAIAPDATLPDGRALSAVLATLDSSAIRLWHA